jgi:hypothetical protein
VEKQQLVTSDWVLHADPAVLDDEPKEKPSAGPIQAAGRGNESLELVQLGARWRALTQHSAEAALSREAALLAERQAILLSKRLLHGLDHQGLMSMCLALVHGIFGVKLIAEDKL